MMSRCVFVLVILTLFMGSVDSYIDRGYTDVPCAKLHRGCNGISCCEDHICTKTTSDYMCLARDYTSPNPPPLNGTKRNMTPWDLLATLVILVWILH